MACSRYLVFNSYGGYWSGTNCGGTPVSADIPAGIGSYTDCVQDGTLFISPGTIVISSQDDCVDATPTPLPTFTPTPSTTPIICGSGVTVGSFHYYFDCCGNQIKGSTPGQIVVLDYTKPSSFVNKSYIAATRTCPSPTPTKTPRATPTVTPTTTITPTPTKTPRATPTITPSPSQSPVYRLKNDCEVFTVFPMGVSCNVIKQPSSPTTPDGILRVSITGGTSPYTVTWENGQVGEYLYNVLPGSWESVVVDFYGDYTASTICNISAVPVTPTPTPTITPTTTPPAMYEPLCILINFTDPQIPDPPQIQFVPGSVVNGKPSWINGTNQLIWNPGQSRWEITNYTVNGGLVVSYTTSVPPLSGWIIEGNPNNVIVTAQNGSCSPTNPLVFELEINNSNCGNCDGSIIIYAGGGVPPYQYSVNGGATFSTSNIFNGLCPNPYNVVVKDSINNNFTQPVTVGTIGASTTYTVGIENISTSLITPEQAQASWKVVVNPPLPVGTNISFNLNIATAEQTYEPGSGTFSHVNVVYENALPILPIDSISSSNTQTRPYCPNVINTFTTYDTYTISISYGDVISGTCTSTLSITNSQVNSSGCGTKLEQDIVVNATNGVISGCNCCSLVTNPKSLGGVFNHTNETNNQIT